jgi:hypothetical protein
MPATSRRLTISLAMKVFVSADPTSVAHILEIAAKVERRGTRLQYLWRKSR